MNAPFASETVEVAEGEYVPLPDTNNYVLPGPAKLKVTRYPDGRVSALVIEGQTRPTRYALIKKLKRVGWGV